MTKLVVAVNNHMLSSTQPVISGHCLSHASQPPQPANKCRKKDISSDESVEQEEEKRLQPNCMTA